MIYPPYFHFGIRVPCLESAMEDIGAALGITWRPINESVVQASTPEGGTREFVARSVYSAGGVPGLELGEERELAEPYPPPVKKIPNLHLGVWVDDLASESARLVAHGWPLAGALLDEDGKPHRTAMHTTPYSFAVELMDIRCDRPWARDLYPQGVTAA